MNEDNEIITDIDDQDLLDGIEQLSQTTNKTNEYPEAKQFAEKIQCSKRVFEKKNKVGDELDKKIETLTEKNNKLEEEI